MSELAAEGRSGPADARDMVGLPRLDAASVAAALFVLGSTLHFFGNNVADPDLWQRLNCGRAILDSGGIPRTDQFSYTAPGLPFVNHEWLSDVWTTLLVARLGSGALIAFKVLVGIATVLLLIDAARLLLRLNDGTTPSGARGADRPTAWEPLPAAAGLALGLAVIAPGASFRPQLWTILFLALEANLLGRADRRLGEPDGGFPWRELLPVPFLLGLWANLHGGFMVGVALAGVFLAALLARAVVPGLTSHEERSRLRGALPLLAGLGLACVAAPVVNPWGPGLYEFLGRTLHLHDEISEWKPIGLLDGEFLRFKLLALLAIAALPLLAAREPAPGDTRARTPGDAPGDAEPVASPHGPSGVAGHARSVAPVPAPVAIASPGGWAWRRIDWRGVFVLAAALAAFRHQRHSVLFGVFATPLVVAGLELGRRMAIARRPSWTLGEAARLAVVSGMTGLALLQLGGFARTLQSDGLAIRYGRLDFPRDAIDFLAASGLRGNVAMPFEWGSYATWNLPPGSRVFIDGRFETVYPPAVVEDYFAFQHGRPGWERVLEAYPTEIVVVQRWREIHPRLFARPDLVYVYSDPAALVFVKRTATNADALARLEGKGAERTAFARQPTIFP